MSVLDQRTIDRDEELLGQGQNPNDTKQLSTASPTTTPSGRGSAFSTGTPASQQGSGRFINLQKYIDANQGAGEQLTSRIANTANRDYQNFQKQLDQSNQGIQSGIDMGKSLIDNEGQQYKNMFQDWNQGLGSFQTLDNRGNFDQVGSQIKDFTGSPQFTDFQKIQSGQGIDQDSLQQSQLLSEKMAADAMAQVQKNAANIQTEQGRYDLLRQTQPKFGNYNLGQGKLDQLFFQTNPSGISNLQQSFGNQLSDVRDRNAALAQQSQNLNNLATSEIDLINALNESALANQNLFNQQLGSQANIKAVNDARSGLYNDYLNQIKTGNYTSDLADMLGLTGMQTYNASKVTMPSGGIGGPKPPIFEGMSGDFSTYNTGDDPTKYIQQSEMQARTLQDVLNQDYYDIYKALADISGYDTRAASGASTLDSAVQRKVGADIAQDIRAANQNFLDNYAGNTYLSQGLGSERYNNTQTNFGEQQHLGIAPVTQQELDQKIADLNARNYGSSGTSPFVWAGSASANMEDYINRNNQINFNLAELNRGSDAQNDIAKARDRAIAASLTPLEQYMQNIINTTGVTDRATIDQNALVDDTRYKNFKGLV